MRCVLVALLLVVASAMLAQGQQQSTKPKVLEFKVEGISFKMIHVEGGRYYRGGDIDNDYDCYEDEGPSHRVTLSDFYIGEVEVTQELWRAVMRYNPSRYKGYKNPVESVSWEDCQVFIGRLNRILGQNFRLPSEAEWEYAARGGRLSRGCKYSGSNKLDDVAWYEKTTADIRHHCRVATRRPNELGIYDMSGNVWEWCQDWYAEYESYPLTNPIQAKGTHRVLRGGCYDGIARSCRVTNRNFALPTQQGFLYGFRLALYQ